MIKNLDQYEIVRDHNLTSQDLIKFEELIVVVPRTALQPVLRNSPFTPLTSFAEIEKIILTHKLLIKRKDAEENQTNR